MELCRTLTPRYQPGQKERLSIQDIRLHQPCHKLSPRYIGPFTMKRQLNKVTYRLNLPSITEFHHPSTYHSSYLTLNLCFLLQQNLVTMKYLLLPT